MRNIRTPSAAVAGLIAAFSVAVALAHQGATGVVADRMRDMSELGDQVKTLTRNLAAGIPDPHTEAIEAARQIAARSGAAMTRHFPEDSINGPSEARSEIWQDWPDFSALANRLEELSFELIVALAEPRPEATPEVEADTQLSEWERLNVEVLLGLKSEVDETSSTDPTENSTSQSPSARPPREIFADVTATCSTCHSRYRK